MADKHTTCKICKGEVLPINKKYNLGQCTQCQLIFCLTLYSQEEFIKVYDELYNSKNAIYSNHSVQEYNMLLENKKIRIGHNREQLIKKNVFQTNCKSVLEIGSGVGLIGAYLRNKNPKIDYLGIEIDQKSFEKSQGLQLNTLNGDFTILDKIDKKFDVIMLWEVLEHLQDLDLFIKLAFEKLNDNGRIILSTPNYDKIKNYPKREKDEIFQDKPPVHLNFFTKQNIVSIFKYNQFEQCKCKVKKTPYLNLVSLKYYTDFIKAIFNQYEGSTLYFEAIKHKNN